jgi:glycosyltransferase involved in cell wall biosynthesis
MPAAAVTLGPPAMRILYVEPHDGGSHAGFGRVLQREIAAQWTAITLPARHWKWHMRAVAAHARLAHAEALARGFDLVLASSYTPLAELVGLVPPLAVVPRVLYFHENQLDFPTRTPEHAERDLHYGVTQLVSALAADVCAFNSVHNRDSFLAAARSLLARMPFAPPGWVEAVAARSEVVPVPIDLPDAAPVIAPPDAEARAAGPILLWNHRWEFDKDPDEFIAALRELDRAGESFRVVICGQRFARVPQSLASAPAWLGARLLHHGYAEDRAAYLAWLDRADVVVSTALHEFFGVAVLEAVHRGALPIVPDRLSYPEVLPAAPRYRDRAGLVAALTQACRDHAAGHSLRADRRAWTRASLTAAVVPRFVALFERVIADQPARLRM